MTPEQRTEMAARLAEYDQDLCGGRDCLGRLDDDCFDAILTVTKTLIESQDYHVKMAGHFARLGLGSAALALLKKLEDKQ